MGTPPKQIIKIEWSSDFAYAIGLIASDGWLARDVPRIGFGSREMEMMENFQKALGLKNIIGRHARGGAVEKKYFYTAFKSKAFYNFLLDIGLMPAKSKIIQRVDVPDKFFADFLRGLFDGDGSFYISRNHRYLNHFVFKTTFASANLDFIQWLQERVRSLCGVRGYIHKGAGVFILVYTKGDSKKLFEAMYHDDGILFLGRKYDKMKNALEHDRELVSMRKNAAVT